MSSEFRYKITIIAQIKRIKFLIITFFVYFCRLMRDTPNIVRHELSVLIPTFNDECFQLVSCLSDQLQPYHIKWEIIVADDGSTNPDIRQKNREIQQIPFCRYIERASNVGRAAIRNFLAQQARYEWLLFLDSDMQIPNGFICHYLTCQESEVIDGGIKISLSQQHDCNLRCLYEMRAEKFHTLEYRQENPYQDFHTANFLIIRKLILENPFDERFTNYGYEDVLFGKSLHEQQIAILHIDNPAIFELFEDNASFLDKTEEGLRTLYKFRTELKDYSHMISKIDLLRHIIPLSIIRLWHRIMGKIERRLLTGKRPNLWVFDLYRLGYFLCLKDQ